MSNTVRAAFIERLGPPEVIQVGLLPEAPLADTQVRVAVTAAAVDPVDTYIRSGRYPTPMPLPFIVGRDLVGTVVDVGAGVEGVAVGDRVWCNSLGHGGRQGAFAERVAVPVDRLYGLPGGCDPVSVVAAAHPAATAWVGLFREAGLGVGETVVVGGGAGNVGTAVTQLAAVAGARVIATARSEDHDWCRAAGAEVVLDYRDPDLADGVAAAAPDGVDVYWDTSGHHDLVRDLPLLADGARVLVTAASDPHINLPVRELYARDVRVLGFVLSKASVADLAAAARVINHRLAGDGLATRVADTLPLEDTAEAHRRIEQGRVRGRLVVRP